MSDGKRIKPGLKQRERAADKLAPHSVQPAAANEDLEATAKKLRIANEELGAANEELCTTSEELAAAYTELEKGQAALRDSEERYRTIAEYTNDWAYWLAPDGRLIYTSPSCERVTGYRADEFLQDPGLLSAIVHPEDRNQIVQHLAQTADPLAGADEQVYRIITRNGEVRWIAHACQPVRGRDGAYLGRRAGHRDITERKQAEEELAASEQRFRLAAESLSDVIYEWDLKESITWFGDVDRLLGYSAGAFSRTLDGWAAALHAEDKDRVWKTVEGQLQGAAPYDVEYRIQGKDSAWYWWSARGTVLRDERGVPCKWIGSVTDITERKRAEAALAAVMEELRSTNDELNATVEELRATNEELSSTNEEVGSANEELRATNEELEEAYQNIEEATAELRRSEVKYRTLTENLPQKIFVKDQNFAYANCNGRFAAEFGLTPEQLVGRNDYEFFPAELADKYRADDKRIMEEGRTVEFEERYLKDGQFSWVQTVKTPLRNEAGEVVGLQGIFWDITERKCAEEALRESEKRFRATVQFLDEGYYSVTVDGLLLDHNQAFNRIMGFDISHDARGSHLPDFWQNPDDRKLYLSELQSKGSVVNHLINAKTIHGDMIVVLASAHLIREENGQVLRIEGTFADITDLKRAEDEVRMLNAELEQRVEQRTAQLQEANSELEAFAHSVSHDLRAPLRGIDGWSMALLEDYSGKLDDQGREYLGRVRAETQRMGHLIDDMLKLSRVSRATMQTGKVDISAIAQSIADRLADSQPGRRVEFVIQSGLNAEGDAKLLEIALENLLDNAWKFTSRCDLARIEVGAVDGDGQEGRIFFVRDNGAGFDMAYADKLFRPFQRLHHVSDFPGTGIGLVTAQRILRRHGGRIWAEAEVNHGATFYFSL